MNKKKVYATTITTLENSLPPLLHAADLPGCIGKKNSTDQTKSGGSTGASSYHSVHLTQLLIEYDNHYPFQMSGYTKLAGCKTYLTG